MALALARNRLFSSSGSAFPVDSIPIARSTSRLAKITLGYEIGVKTLILWESLGNAAKGASASWSHVSSLCPEIHTYSHTRQFTKINCLIRTFPRCPRSESDRRWLVADPKSPWVSGRFLDAKFRRTHPSMHGLQLDRSQDTPDLHHPCATPCDRCQARQLCTVSPESFRGSPLL